MAAGEPYSPGPASPDSGATGISFCRSDVKGNGKMSFSTAHHVVPINSWYHTIFSKELLNHLVSGFQYHFLRNIYE